VSPTPLRARVSPRSRLLGEATAPPAAGLAVLSAAYLSEFYAAATVVDAVGRLTAVVTASLAAAVLLGQVLSVRRAIALSAAALAVGGAVFLLSVPESRRAGLTVGAVWSDVRSLLLGMSVLRLAAVDVWVATMAPVPTFLTWYLAVRGRPVGAAAVAGGALGFFVLTGDAGTATTLAGAVGAALTAGLSTLRVAGGFGAHWDTLAVVVAAMVVLSATLAVVPSGAVAPGGGGGGAGPADLESTLDASQDRVRVVGAINLSPKVRFTVESDEPANWRTAAYDRYTGDGWIRTGEPTPYDGPREGPPGQSVRVEQTVTARSSLDALPAADSPVALGDGPAGDARVTETGGIQPGAPLSAGDSYRVTSERVDASAGSLRAAGDDYPDEVGERYTQLPSDTPDRVEALTDEVRAAAGAENPYDAALAVQAYLRATKNYSLSVDRPQGDVADGFLFEMDAGYCTYFATTMVTMLRTQGIPAKFVTGYTTGEEVRDGEYVVRGQNAHAWVQVYFPDHGWVAFDPTPSADREAIRRTSLAEAREAGVEDVDTAATEPDPDDPSALGNGSAPVSGAGGNGTERPLSDADPVDPDAEVNASLQYEGDEEFGLSDADDGFPDPGAVSADAVVDAPPGESAAAPAAAEGSRLPVDRDRLGYGLLAVFGLLAGAYRVGATARVRRAAWLRFQRRRGPEVDVAGAYARLEYMLGRRYRPRRAGETPREYVTALGERADLDDRIHEVARLYERAAYAGGAAPEDAARAVRTVRRLALESTPGLRRLLT